MGVSRNHLAEGRGPSAPGAREESPRTVDGIAPAPDGAALVSTGFDQLYADYFAPLVAYLQSSFGSGPPEPEDVAQRAFGRLVARGNLGEIQNLQAFLWRTARNIAMSDKRAAQVRLKRKPETEILFSSSDGYAITPERVLEGKEQVALAEEVLRAMPEQRRRAFVLTRIEGLSHAETSKRLGISRPAVTKHVARATADLYAVLMKP